ncbi:GxxExxY protein [Silvibacterium bohemicum]|uniref:GxxExxY protein n=1 Tax=Silvibacterium bohemicum TaxID=1577686 RepID=A0A841K067_9BACT|nr:GxxExxY protein [Silvibacterium bohemicum]MBB6147143.1 GxxExxY protein [Silvibacterium bohemicum]
MAGPEVLNELARQAVDSAIAVHSALGPGLLESTHQACLAHELRKRGLEVKIQVGLPVVYDGVRLELGYRIDILIAESVILEIKSIDAIAPIHRAQLLSYLRLSGCRLGLLMNFNVPLMKDGIVRMVNGL